MEQEKLFAEKNFLTFCVTGDAKPLSRPRFSGRRAYLPQRDRQYREVVQAAARRAMDGRSPMTGELSCRVKFYRKYKRTARIFGDVDNLLKAILDALNGICFDDDAAIVKVIGEKYTDKQNPRVEVEIANIP